MPVSPLLKNSRSFTEGDQQEEFTDDAEEIDVFDRPACQQGHKLQRYLVSEAEGNVCDGCMYTFHAPESIYRCFMCNFDLCQQCYRHAKQPETEACSEELSAPAAQSAGYNTVTGFDRMVTPGFKWVHTFSSGSTLFDWVPIRCGKALAKGSVQAGHSQRDGDVYVGRGPSGEPGKLCLLDNRMSKISCHHTGSSDHGDVLIVRDGVAVEWKSYEIGDPLPPGAVYAGVFFSDGDVYVAREQGGPCGKLSVRKSKQHGEVLNKLWTQGHFLPYKQGEILVLS